MKGLALILGGKPKGKMGDEGEPPAEEAKEPTGEAGDESEYKSLAVEAAKAGDWEGLVDAVFSYAKSCSMGGEGS